MTIPAHTVNIIHMDAHVLPLHEDTCISIYKRMYMLTPTHTHVHIYSLCSHIYVYVMYLCKHACSHVHLYALACATHTCTLLTPHQKLSLFPRLHFLPGICGSQL